MEDGKCCKRYPREFREETSLPEAMYPLYRRRDLGRTADKAGHTMDSRDVVPYNPGLTKKYGCHLNIEIVTSIKSVKYLYKYSYKGHDRATLELGEEIIPGKKEAEDAEKPPDEIKNHIDARYVGPPEAAWRLFGFHMSGRSHHVERLAVHLPGIQRLLFEMGQEEAALATAAGKRTTLLAWFELNQDPKNAQARELRYAQIPEHYVWHMKTRKWAARTSVSAANKVIGRLHGAALDEGARFYLNLLLLH